MRRLLTTPTPGLHVFSVSVLTLILMLSVAHGAFAQPSPSRQAVVLNRQLAQRPSQAILAHAADVSLAAPQRISDLELGHAYLVPTSETENQML